MHVGLRTRLTLVFALAMALVLVALGAFVYVRLRSDLLAAVDLSLRPRGQALADAVAAGTNDLRREHSTMVDQDEAFGQVLDGSGAIVDTSPGVAAAALLSVDQLPRGRAPVFRTLQVSGFDAPVRLLAASVDSRAGPRVVLVGATLGDLRDSLARISDTLLIAGPVGLFLSAAGGWLLAGAALRPVERMRREAAAVSASEPSRRLVVPPNRDELARLATTLNAMLDRLQEALERERRFVDDASHELRSPLATLRAEIDLALARPRAGAELEQSLRSAGEDVQRLQRLTEDLLILARSNGGRVPVRPEDTSLPDLLARSAAMVQSQATTSGVDLTVTPTEGTAHLDPERVKQAIRNLLDNAIRHTPRGGQVELSATRSESRLRITVTDSGPGFAPDVLTRAFEPFARSAAGGSADGLGLGLSIVRAVAEAHGGTAMAENAPGGARVTLDLRA